MLVQPPLNVVCDPDVQCGAMFGGENVNPIIVVAYPSQKQSEMFRFAQHDRIARFDLQYLNRITCAVADSISASTPSLHQSLPQ
jgi:hypothetical protein